MDIIVPETKSPLPHHGSPLVSVARTLGVLGFVGAILLFSMVFSEGQVHFPYVQITVELVAVAFLGFLLTWRHMRIGGAVVTAAMIAALFLTPLNLLEWRLYFFIVEGLLALIGLLILFSPTPKAPSESSS